MPISRDEFERREIDPHLAVLDLLRGKPNSAFTLEDIRSSLLRQRQLSIEVLKEITRSLGEQGSIESADIGGEEYYIYRRPSGPGGRRG